jgi:uncharacterized delta-60 repeat protein
MEGRPIPGWSGTALRLTSIVLQKDGRIVVAGSDNDGYAARGVAFGLRRLTSTGSLDATFGVNGALQTTVGDDAYAKSVALQSDSKIVVAGSSDFQGLYNFAVARYLHDGAGASDPGPSAPFDTRAITLPAGSGPSPEPPPSTPPSSQSSGAAPSAPNPTGTAFYDRSPGLALYPSGRTANRPTNAASPVRTPATPLPSRSAAKGQRPQCHARGFARSKARRRMVRRARSPSPCPALRHKGRSGHRG